MKIPSLTRQNWLDGGLVAALLVGAYFALFFQLGSTPINVWDEARLAVSAVEMKDEGHWLVATYQRWPDLWNTKPPLLIWLQSISFQLWGLNEVALRLPSALAALATAAQLGWFGYRYLGSRLVAALSVLILLTTEGYIAVHVARTGDYDALLICFQTAYLLGYFRYLETGRRTDFIRTAVFIGLAILTKGVAGALPLPALLLYTLLQHRLGWVLKQPAFYAAVGGVVAVVLGYYGLREAAFAGYWRAVYKNELGGRLLATIETHAHPFDWYWQSIVEHEFVPWLYVLPLGFLFSQQVGGAVQRFGQLALVFLAVFLLTISVAQTKLGWYEAPLYPLAALLAAYGVAGVIEAVLAHFHFRRAAPWVLAGVLLSIFWLPARAIERRLAQFRAERYNDPDQRFGQYLRQQQAAHPELRRYTMLFREEYNPSAEFYGLAMMARYQHVVLLGPRSLLDQLPFGQIAVVCDPHLLNAVRERYQTEALFQDELGTTLRIGTHQGAGQH